MEFCARSLNIISRENRWWRHEMSAVFSGYTTGSPSWKYEHRQASALLRNVQNIRICTGKKPVVSVTYENERISIKKNSLPYLKCVLRLSCVVHGPIYGRFMGFYVLTVFSHKTAINRPVDHTGET